MFPRWVSWVFLLTLGYLIYLGHSSPHTTAIVPKNTVNGATSPTPATPPAEYRALDNFTNPNRWQRALNPDYVGHEKMTDATVGTGDPVQCGDHVRVHVRGTLSNGANFDDAHDDTKPLEFVAGDAPYPILNTTLIGMREGGVRQITAPPATVYAQDKAPTRDDVLLRVTLDKNNDTLPAKKDFFGNRTVIDRDGTGDAVACGTEIKVLLRAWNNDGSLRYATTEPAAVTPGKAGLPLALSRGLTAMHLHELRSIVFVSAPNDDVQQLPSSLRAAFAHHQVVLLTAERVN